MSLKLPKAAGVATCAAITSAFLFSHFTGEIYPYTNIAITAGTIGVFLIASTDERISATWPMHLGQILILSVAYRLRIIVFPASMIGMDPDRYAVQISQVVQEGVSSAIAFWFYEEASVHIVVGAIMSVIGGIPAPVASAGYGVILGVGLPLLGATLTRQLRPNRPLIAVYVCGATALLPYSVRFSYLPVAQSLGVFFMLFSLFVAYRYVITSRKRYLMLFLFLVFTAVHTHKLPGIAISAVFIIAGMFSLLYQSGRDSQYLRPASFLVVISGSIMVLQLFYTTEFGSFAVSRAATILFEDQSVTTAPLTPTAAVDPYRLSTRVFRLLSVLLLAVLGGIAWISWVKRTLTGTVTIRDTYFLGLVAALASLVFVLYPFDVNPVRTIFYSEVFLVVLIVISIFSGHLDHSSSLRTSKHVAIAGMVILMAVLGGSPIAGPDYDSVDRQYLTENEVDAKSFGYQYGTGSITTDPYLAHEIPPERITRGLDNGSQFQSSSGRYLNNDFDEFDGTIAHRTCTDLIRSLGVWRLTWDPKEEFSSKYHAVYDSPCVTYYSNEA